MSILWSLAVLFLAEWRLSGVRCDDDTRQCVSLTSLSLISASLHHTLTQLWGESGKEKTWQIHVLPPRELWSTTCSVRDAFGLWIVEVGRHGQRGGGDHLLRDGPQRVRRVLSVLHVPRSLTVHHRPDPLESLPQVQCNREEVKGIIYHFFLFVCRRERSSDNLDQAQEECIKWVIQRDNKRWEDTDTELTTYKKHIIFYLLFLLVNWYLFEITTRGNIFYHQTWPIRLLLCLLCLWVWCFQCNNVIMHRCIHTA